jgi:dihydroorotase
MSRTTNRTVIRGGTVLDRNGQSRADVAFENGMIVEVGPTVDGGVTLDAAGCIVAPGFVDLHVHLREPGREEAETIETGSRAAALGGFTAIVAMPNTEPAQDSLAVVEFVRAQARRAALCDVHPAGCITMNREGTALAPFGELAAAGVRIFTDDGNGVQDPQLMRHALEYARALDITLAQHCEVAAMTKGAVMHEGSCCSSLGLPGWPAIAEELMVHRDIELCRLTGSRVHLLHLSTARSIDLVRAAKADGLPVTAEAAPHHFTLTHELLANYDAVFKVNPPLRTTDDIAASKQAWPTARSTPSPPITPRIHRNRGGAARRAPPGCSAETALALALTELDMPVADVVAALSFEATAIAGIAIAMDGPLPSANRRRVFDRRGVDGGARQACQQGATRRTQDERCGKYGTRSPSSSTESPSLDER